MASTIEVSNSFLLVSEKHVYERLFETRTFSHEMVLLQIQKVREMEFVLWNLVPACTSFLLYPVK